MKMTMPPIGLASFATIQTKSCSLRLSTLLMKLAIDYLEAPESNAALAAAEVVAALLGKPSASLPDDAKECIGKLNLKPSEKLVAAARKAVKRVKTDSELKELWDESDDAVQWQTTVEDLAARLK